MHDDEPVTMRPAAAPRKRSGGFWVLAFVFGMMGIVMLFFVLGILGIVGNAFMPPTSGELEEVLVDGDRFSEDKLLQITVSGMIMDGGGGLFGDAVTTPSGVRQVLERAREDESIRGVLLVVNSPGGGVTASDTILDELKRFKADTNLPVVAYFKDIAASGGYYVAMAADEIHAHPTTITGSIGVILRMVNYRGLYEKIGLSETTIMSDDTPFKDMGSPTREMEPAERERFESIIQEMYERFVDVVDAGRPSLERERVEAIANGSIYSAKQALENGLVDSLGYRHDALAALRARAGVGEDAAIVAFQPPLSLLETMLMKAAPGAKSHERVAAAVSERLLPSGSGLLYLWPGFDRS